MTRRIVTALARALTPSSASHDVHFHGGASGPYVCEDPRCTSPGLDVGSG
jgi:hypothetical protein